MIDQVSGTATAGPDEKDLDPYFVLARRTNFAGYQSTGGQPPGAYAVSVQLTGPGVKHPQVTGLKIREAYVEAEAAYLTGTVTPEDYDELLLDKNVARVQFAQPLLAPRTLRSGTSFFHAAPAASARNSTPRSTPAWNRRQRCPFAHQGLHTVRALGSRLADRIRRRARPGHGSGKFGYGREFKRWNSSTPGDRYRRCWICRRRPSTAQRSGGLRVEHMPLILGLLVIYAIGSLTRALPTPWSLRLRAHFRPASADADGFITVAALEHPLSMGSDTSSRLPGGTATRTLSFPGYESQTGRTMGLPFGGSRKPRPGSKDKGHPAHFLLGSWQFQEPAVAQRCGRARHIAAVAFLRKRNPDVPGIWVPTTRKI
jgi:hypothetical protein